MFSPKYKSCVTINGWPYNINDTTTVNYHVAEGTWLKDADKIAVYCPETEVVRKAGADNHCRLTSSVDCPIFNREPTANDTP